MALQLLSELTIGFKYVTICVRVSRMWDFRGATDEGPIKHTDLILIDEKGNHMYAEIGKDDVNTKKPLLQEGKVYIIKKFGVTKARADYKAVENPFMIRFTYHTIIEERITIPPTFPLYTYNLVPFEKLPNYIDNKARFLDVIGAIVGVSEAEWVHTPGKNTPSLKRIVILKDVSELELKVTLWGNRAEQFDSEKVYEIGQKQPVIAIFVGCLMKNYSGENTLSGNSACRWYINENIPDIHSFYERLEEDFEKVKKVAVSTREQRYSISVDKLQKKDLIDLKDLDPYEHKDHTYLATVTITRLSPNQQWWFAQCKACGKAARLQNNTYKCRQGCQVTDVKFRYKLCIMGTDGTVEVEFILFGEVAHEIIKKPFNQLQAKMHNNDVPIEIKEIISQKYSFAVSISTSSCYNKGPSFEVKKVLFQFEKSVIPTHVNAIASSSKGNTKHHMAPLIPIKSLSTPQHSTRTQSKDLGNDDQLTEVKTRDQCSTTQKRHLSLSQDTENIFHAESETNEDLPIASNSSPAPDNRTTSGDDTVKAQLSAGKNPQVKKTKHYTN